MAASDLATVTASTKRFPSPSAGKISAPALHLAKLPITPLQSVSAELAQEVKIEDPRELKMTCCFTNSSGNLYDVREGDILVASGTEYIVQSAAEFNRSADGSYTRLIIQERKIS